MRCFGQSRSRLVLVVTVAGLCAATAPGNVRADDGAEPSSIDASEIAAVPQLEESVAAIVVDAVEGSTEELEAAEAVTGGAADDPEEEAGSSGGVPDAVEASLETGAPDAEQPEEVPNPALEAGSEPDTTSDSGDTTSGSTTPATIDVAGSGGAAPPAAPPPPRATTTPTGSANVNVSVRIGSAGDNGAVTQTNTGAAAPASGAPRNATSAPSSAQDTEGQTISQDPESTWYWEWDCLGFPVVNPISPDRSTSGSTPQTWTWIWNCPDNFERYQEESGGQYQQVNANVSIRVSSPGDDGPVTQTNIAAAVSAQLPEVSLASIPALPSLSAITLAAPAISLPPISISTPSISISTPSIGRDVPGIAWGITSPIPLMPNLALAPALSFGSDVPWVIEVGGGELPFEAAVELVVGTSASVEPEPLVLPSRDLAPAPSPTGVRAVPEQRHRSAAVEPTRAPVESTEPGWAAGSSPSLGAVARGAHEVNAPPRTKPAPSWKPSAATSGRGAPSTAPPTASASAAGAGGGSGGGLPIFLALPFLAAVLDLARRVALDRATWPSGHRRRMPDTPG